MYNKIIRFVITLILSSITSFLLAEQIETQISADTITVERGEILFAEGNVLVQYGSNKIKAKALKFNQRTKEIKFTGIQDFQDGKAINLSAAEAVISSDLSKGIISAANLILDETIKIQTGEVRLKYGQIASVSGISSVTSCDQCEGKAPKFQYYL
jgi:lipopolysaccharide assembly outer membrane protein LptD (OstA)